MKPTDLLKKCRVNLRFAKALAACFITFVALNADAGDDIATLRYCATRLPDDQVDIELHVSGKTLNTILQHNIYWGSADSLISVDHWGDPMIRFNPDGTATFLNITVHAFVPGFAALTGHPSMTFKPYFQGNQFGVKITDYNFQIYHGDHVAIDQNWQVIGKKLIDHSAQFDGKGYLTHSEMILAHALQIVFEKTQAMLMKSLVKSLAHQSGHPSSPPSAAASKNGSGDSLFALAYEPKTHLAYGILNPAVIGHSMPAFHVTGVRFVAATQGHPGGEAVVRLRLIPGARDLLRQKLNVTLYSSELMEAIGQILREEGGFSLNSIELGSDDAAPRTREAHIVKIMGQLADQTVTASLTMTVPEPNRLAVNLINVAVDNLSFFQWNWTQNDIQEMVASLLTKVFTDPSSPVSFQHTGLGFVSGQINPKLFGGPLTTAYANLLHLTIDRGHATATYNLDFTQLQVNHRRCNSVHYQLHNEPL